MHHRRRAREKQSAPMAVDPIASSKRSFMRFRRALSILRYSLLCCFSLPFSQARAIFQSRLTVSSHTSSSAAVSATL